MFQGFGHYGHLHTVENAKHLIIVNKVQYAVHILTLLIHLLNLVYTHGDVIAEGHYTVLGSSRSRHVMPDFTGGRRYRP